jgi:hypothetical protein
MRKTLAEAIVPLGFPDPTRRINQSLRVPFLPAPLESHEFEPDNNSLWLFYQRGNPYALFAHETDSDIAFDLWKSKREFERVCPFLMIYGGTTVTAFDRSGVAGPT